MPADPKTEPELTPYQQAKLKKKPREVWCGLLHDSIEEAIVHAETALGMRNKEAEPYWGRTQAFGTTVVGWQVNDAKRYRLDFAMKFAEQNASAPEWSGTPHLKGTQGVHVNQENYVDPENSARSQVCHPTRSSVMLAETQWRKWTKRFDLPK